MEVDQFDGPAVVSCAAAAAANRASALVGIAGEIDRSGRPVLLETDDLLRLLVGMLTSSEDVSLPPRELRGPNVDEAAPPEPPEALFARLRRGLLPGLG